jgi:hypothetical protein
MKTGLSFKLDQRLKAALEKLAKEEDRSLSNYVATVLMRHVESRGVSWMDVSRKIERRLYPRVPVEWPATINTAKLEIEGKVENVSPDGALFVSCPEFVPIKGVLHLVINPPKRQPVKVTAEVAWTSTFENKLGESCLSMGLQFVEMSSGDSQLLHDLIRSASEE